MKKLLAAWVNSSLWYGGAALMRRMRFPGKMMLISVAFMVPIALLLTMMVSNRSHDIDFVAQERAGVRYASAIYPAIDLAGAWRQQARNAAFGEGGEQLGAARQAFDAAFLRLQQIDADVGTKLSASSSFAAVSSAVQAAQAAQPVAGVKADPEAVYQGMIGVSRSLAALLDAVTDGSGLVIDPDLHSYHLMTALLLTTPELIQTTVEVRGLVRSALKTGQIAADNAARLQGYLAILTTDAAQAKITLDKVQKASPEYSQRLTRGAIDATQEMVKQVRSSIPAGVTEVKGDASAFVMGANALLQTQFKQVVQNLAVLDAMLADRQAALSRSLWVALTATLLSLLLAAYFFMGFYSAMENGFKMLRQHLIRISMGDLRTPIKTIGRDEVTGLLKELGNMQEALAITVQQVQNGSEAVVSSSIEIAQGTQDLAARTESAAAALEQSSAALEQTNATVAMTAESVSKASKIATENAHTASKGGAVMQDVADTMGRIQTSSQKISDIISVIDGIAFQTNILALNAAVEAARAGEQGRGFAVVATEVRALAGRSAVAAKEIKVLITTSTGEVRRGSEIVRQASEHMHQIVAKADDVEHLLDEVSNGAREQCLGIGQIGEAVQELDKNTQANAALVEQTAALANTLQGVAVRMAAQVDEFRLPGVQVAHLVEGVDVDSFIDGHRQWKVKLRDAIENGDRVDVATLSRDDCCGLGKWIYADGQRLRGRASFSALIDTHANFHRVAGQVGQLINDGQFDRAENALAPSTPFTQATSEVVMVLSAAKRLGFV